MLAADLDHRVPRLRLPQQPQNLLFAVPRFAISMLSSLVPENHVRLRSLNFTAAYFLGFGSGRDHCNADIYCASGALAGEGYGPQSLSHLSVSDEVFFRSAVL